MNRLIRIITAALVLGFSGVLLTSAQAQSDDVPAAQTPLLCILTGTITNQRSGLPIKGVRLTLTGESVHSTPTQTDADGTYKFTQPPGLYAIKIQALGYIGGVKWLTLQQQGRFDTECNQELNVTLTGGKEPSSPTPRPDPVTTAYNNAVARYCKTAKQMACTFYQEHASGCLSDASLAPVIYRGVLGLKKQGLSSTQAIQATVEVWANSPTQLGLSLSDFSDIAEAAALVIDTHRRTDEAVFTQAVLRTCLDHLARE